MTEKGFSAVSRNNRFTKRDYMRLFIMGALLGAVIFVIIYGVKILNPSYIGWIYYGDNDLKQHYIGWSHYRNSSWRFPLGLIETLSYPTNMSVIYTDSIPIACLFFKLFSGVLPEDFQFFGIIGILSFALCGGTAAVLLKRFIKNSWVCLLATPVFVASFPIIQRMYYHTALAAHWMIFLALIIWVYDTFEAKSFKSEIVWGIFGFACVSIHSYFLAIIGMILLADRINFLLLNKWKIIKAITPIISFCLMGLLALWIFGGLYGDSSAAGFGLGTFGANFNTFINPIDYGRILPNLGVENYFQYEGCGYLGFGVILLAVLAIALLIVKRKSLETIFAKNDRNRVFVGTGIFLFLLSFATATLPKISIGTWSIGQINYPEPIYKIASIFRSNGRFIWTGMYLLMIAIIVLTVKLLEDKKGVLVAALAVMVVVQGVDLSKMISEKQKYYYADHEFTTIWDTNLELSRVAHTKEHFVFLYNENDLNMETAFYAYRNGMSLNNFYFARDIDSEVTKEINKYLDELRDGLVRDDTVYIMKMDDYNANAEYLKELGVETALIEGHAVFSKR